MNYNIGKFAIKGEEDKNKKWDEIINNSDFTDLQRMSAIYGAELS